MRPRPTTALWLPFLAALLTACASDKLPTVVEVRIERVAPPADLLNCAPDPAVPDAPDQRAVAVYLLDLWDAGEDCRRKLGAVRGFVMDNEAD